VGYVPEEFGLEIVSPLNFDVLQPLCQERQSTGLRVNSCLSVALKLSSVDFKEGTEPAAIDWQSGLAE